jgi:hypothetical protein
MHERKLGVAAALVVTVLFAAGTAASAANAPWDGSLAVRAQETLPTPTATARPGEPPDGRGQGRPENAGQPDGTPGGKPEDRGAAAQPTGSATPGGGLSRPAPQLPERASVRAHVAVEAAAQKHDLLRQRLEALRALPTGADRTEAVKSVLADFGDLFHLVSDAVHSVDAPKSTPTATATATGTPTATPTP